MDNKRTIQFYCLEELCPVCFQILTDDGEWCNYHGRVRPQMNDHVRAYNDQLFTEQMTALNSNPDYRW
jgi:hypothetical protein